MNLSLPLTKCLHPERSAAQPKDPEYSDLATTFRPFLPRPLLPRIASLCLATTLLIATASAFAQQQQEEPLTTLKLQTRIVAIAASVHDPHGTAIGALTADDFELKQDGKPQQIRYFSQGSDLPLTLTLMVDTSGSQRNFLPDESQASMVFFRALLQQQNDRAALVQFDSAILQLAPMTASVDNLQRSLGYLSYPHKSTLPNGIQGTLLYDAIAVTAQQLLKSERGRRAMVLLTDGDDYGSHRTLDDAIAAAQKSDIVLYAIEYSANAYMAGLGAASSRTKGQEALDKLTSATGGKVFQVSEHSTLRQIFAELNDDLRLQYQLAFTPPDDAPGTYHKLELRTKDHHLKVQARRGFYTPTLTP